ncbi:hypothetical protein P3T76_004043 [Phytophthora citrophthora]|uniref:SCP domain-containing protein n=1 Tax=Phytophthora citrophthora TaxID=4793 RepID=A0AAD9GU47_9STRA|nr:hypothetical protein P3T76_004043 [Phytophthora citrophthora]
MNREEERKQNTRKCRFANPPLLSSLSLALPVKLMGMSSISQRINHFLLPPTIDAAVYLDLQRVVKVFEATRKWTVGAMDGAAARGHLKIVKHVDSTRSEGCSPAAFNGAAVNNRLDVLRWLCKWHSSKCNAPEAFVIHERIVSLVGHDGHLPPNTRVTDAGYKWQTVAENIDAGNVNADAVVEWWMQNDRRDNVLGKYTMAGSADVQQILLGAVRRNVTLRKVQTMIGIKSSLFLLAAVSNTLAFPDNLENDVFPAYGYPSEYAPKVLKAVNQIRKNQRLPPLCNNKKLQAAAMRLCYDEVPSVDSIPLFQNLRALNTDDLDKVERYVTEAGFACDSSTQHFFDTPQCSSADGFTDYGHSNITETVASWYGPKDSSPVLTGNYTMVGTAYVFVNSSDYKHYWAQVYASGSTEECDSEDPVGSIGQVVGTVKPDTQQN